MTRVLFWLAWLGAAALIPACTTQKDVPTASTISAPAPASVEVGELPPTQAQSVEPPARQGGEPDRALQAQVYPGSGRVLGTSRSGLAQIEGETKSADGVTLNFIDAAIDDVAAAILGDTLKVNYIVEPGLQGRITIQTSDPIPRELLIPTFEAALSLNNAAIVADKGLYRIVSLTKARQGAAPARTGPPAGILTRGYTVLAVPLKFIAAGEMQKILESLALKENVLHVDSARNVVILAGTEQELTSLNDAIEIFDVDWLSGMSFGIFPIRFASAETIANELKRIFLRDDDSRKGVVEIVPIERLNSILVVTPQPKYLERVTQWVELLDRRGDGSQRQIFVYYVRNARAERLASALSEIFSEDEAEKKIPTGLAPGQAPVELRSPGGADFQASAAGNAGLPPGSAATGNTPAGAGDGIALRTGAKVRIIADPDHNALIILATPQEYRMVEATLRKLDIVPLQVLIQASIFEVTLTDELRYGVRWFFERGNNSLELSNLPAAVGGFSYAFSTANFASAIEALASITKLNLLSSPELLVLDNQTASLQVGDQVPVATRQSQSVTDPDAPIVSSVQFRNTGVILRVTPRINAGGLVTMDIQQEVSDVTPSDGPTVTPTIFQRSISSTVAVQSGEIVALGGLISENIRHGRSGVPILHEIPFLGALFRSTSEDSRRTELLILLTPRVVRNQAEARMVTDEIRRRMKNVQQYIQEGSGSDVGVGPFGPRWQPGAIAPSENTAGDAMAAGTAPVERSTAGAKSDRAELASERAQIASALIAARGQVGHAATPLGASPEPVVRPRREPPYAVHLASHRSQAAAQAEWRELSEKFPDILGSLRSRIERTDLGARGIFFRLKAGPIEDRSAAGAICRRLKDHRQYCQVFRGLQAAELR